MSFKLPLAIFLVISITFIGCNKTSNPKPIVPHGTDIYIAGVIGAKNGNAVAVYWKNGVITKLTDSSSNCTAIAIAVNGTDVYVVGMQKSTLSGPSVAVYWKNGTLTQLSNPGVDTYTTGIAVSGTDVYISGYTVSGYGSNASALYWKNGVATSLTDGTNPDYALGIAVNGSDVYVCGNSVHTLPLNYSASILWKNNVATQLPGGGQAYGIAFSGNNMYVGGNVGSDAGVWLNGNGNAVDNIPGGYTLGFAIAASGTDVYLAGNYYLPAVGDSHATYWKNGVATILSNNRSNGNGIALSGSDVYVVGYIETTSSNIITFGYSTNGYALYWKNGVINKLYNAGSNAVGIAIVQH